MHNNAIGSHWPLILKQIGASRNPHMQFLKGASKKCRIKTTRSYFRPSHASDKSSRWKGGLQILGFPASKKTRLDVLGWLELNEYSIRCQYQIIWSLCYVCSHMHSWIKRVEETQGFGSKTSSTHKISCFFGVPRIERHVSSCSTNT